MSPALNGKSVIRRFKHSNAIEKPSISTWDCHIYLASTKCWSCTHSNCTKNVLVDNSTPFYQWISETSYVDAYQWCLGLLWLVLVCIHALWLHRIVVPWPVPWGWLSIAVVDHTDFILCYLGQRTFPGGLVRRLENDNKTSSWQQFHCKTYTNSSQKGSDIYSWWSWALFDLRLYLVEYTRPWQIWHQSAFSFTHVQYRHLPFVSSINQNLGWSGQTI